MTKTPRKGSVQRLIGRRGSDHEMVGREAEQLRKPGVVNPR
jgi:hypothetical protein